ncbi:CAZy families GH97 protein, partial [Operophtera brumata]
MGFINASVTKLRSSSSDGKITCPPLLVQLPAGSDIVLNVIKRIKHEFTSCTNMMDKVILVLTHLGQYV